MHLSTTFRHMDASQAVREYSEEKLEKIRKYFHKEPIAAHAVFSVERGFHHVADINITLPSGLLINAKETTDDMYSSIDLVMAKIERQCRRYKEKLQDHRADLLHGGREIVHSFFHLDEEASSAEPHPVTRAIAPSNDSKAKRLLEICKGILAWFLWVRGRSKPVWLKG